MKNSKCQKYWNYGITLSMICAGFPYVDDKDACYGDSGGPLVCDDNGKAVLTGVVSFGYVDNNCKAPSNNEEQPGVYGRITHVLPWIKKHMVSVLFLYQNFSFIENESYLAQIYEKFFKLFNLIF